MSTVDAPPAPPPPAAGAVEAGVDAAVVVELSLLLLPQAPRPTTASAPTTSTAEALFIRTPFLSSPSWPTLLRAAKRFGLASVALELRRVASEEGGDSATQVVRAHGVRDPVPLELQVIVDRVLDRFVQKMLGHADVVRCLRGQLLGLLPRALEQLVGRDDLCDKAGLERRLGVEVRVVQRQLECLRRADHARQEVGPPPVRSRADAAVGDREERVLGCDADVG